MHSNTQYMISIFYTLMHVSKYIICQIRCIVTHGLSTLETYSNVCSKWHPKWSF